jgi:hypothetical protein
MDKRFFAPKHFALVPGPLDVCPGPGISRIAAFSLGKLSSGLKGIDIRRKKVRRRNL